METQEIQVVLAAAVELVMAQDSLAVQLHQVKALLVVQVLLETRERAAVVAVVEQAQ
jgi:hypothetical protein